MSLINDALKRASQTIQDQPAEARIEAQMEPVQTTARKSIVPIVLCLAALLLITVAGVLFMKVWREPRNAKPALAATRANKSTPVHNTAKTPEVAPSTEEPVAPAAKSFQPAVEPQVAPNKVAVPAQAAAVQAPVAVPTPSAKSDNTVVTQPPIAPTTTSVPLVAKTAAADTDAEVQKSPGTPPPGQKASPVATAPTGVVSGKPERAGEASAPAAAPVAVSTDPIPLLPAGFPNVKLRAILFNPTAPAAMINDKVLGVGEKIEGVRIVKIEQRKVVVEWQGSNRDLYVGE